MPRIEPRYFTEEDWAANAGAERFVDSEPMINEDDNVTIIADATGIEIRFIRTGTTKLDGIAIDHPSVLDIWQRKYTQEGVTGSVARLAMMAVPLSPRPEILGSHGFVRVSREVLKS